MRRDFENESAGDFSDSQWLSLIEEATRQEVSAWIQHETQGHSGGPVLDNVEIPCGWEGVLLTTSKVH